MKEISNTKREDIRKINKGNSFYDTFLVRTFKENQEYKFVAGITKAVFSRGK